MASNGLKLTDELADSLALAVSKGVPIETACRAAGISSSTVYTWLRVAKSGVWDAGDDVDGQSKVRLGRFADLIARAQAEWEAKQVEMVVQAAQAVNAKTGLRDWRANAWLLNNHPQTRQTYRQHKEVTIDSNSTVTHEYRMVQSMSIDELDGLSDQLALPDSPSNG